MNQYKVIHKQADRRFEILEDGAVSYVEYYLHDGALDIRHTIVP
jgi:predicted GNAT family acetyltransferase